MIIGIHKLSKEQKDLMFRTNELHTKCVGNDYKDGMKITKVWIDENNTVCVKHIIDTEDSVSSSILYSRIITSLIKIYT